MFPQPESANCEFKYWESTKNVKDLVRRLLQDTRLMKCLLAFPNTPGGGHLFLGITDDKQVKGQNISPQCESRVRDSVKNIMTIDQSGNPRVWAKKRSKENQDIDSNGKESKKCTNTWFPEEDREWVVSFIPVTENCPKDDKCRRVIIHISVPQFCGGVFEKCPECYGVTDSGHVILLPLLERLIDSAESCESTAGTCSDDGNDSNKCQDNDSSDDVYEFDNNDGSLVICDEGGFGKNNRTDDTRQDDDMKINCNTDGNFEEDENKTDSHCLHTAGK
jgi:hypothetical protein